MQVVVACRHDFAPWLHLAAEVELLFGSPMSRDEGFQRTLRRNIARGTAYCVRADDGPPGSRLLGGLFYSPKPPIYTISWLVVTASQRRSGIGQAMLGRALLRVVGPGTLRVTTFTADEPEGAPARAFYASMGLVPAELLDTPFGPRQRFQLDLPPGELAFPR